MKYVVYNKMVGPRGLSGHKYIAYKFEAKSKSEAMKMAHKENKEWNRRAGRAGKSGDGYQAVTYGAREMTPRPRQPSKRSPSFGITIGKRIFRF